MHEVSLCRSLATAVIRAAGDRRVETILVDVGQLRQVVPEAMAHAWVFVVRNTALDGAELQLNPISDCDHEAELGPELGFACHSCGSANTRLVSGEEFTLTAIDVASGPVATKGIPDGPLPPP